MRDTINVINKLKEEGLIKDYAIGGAIGALKWVEPFFTRDLDIFIPLEKSTDFSWWSLPYKADGGLIPPSAQTVNPVRDKSLTGLENRVL